MITLIGLWMIPLIQDTGSWPEELREIDALRRELQMLQALQEAGVTEEQARDLLRAIDEHRTGLEAYVEENRDRIDEARRVMEEARDLLAAGKEIGGELQKRLDALRKGVGDLLTDEIKRRSGRLVEAARTILDQEQINTLLVRGRPGLFAAIGRGVRKGLESIRRLSDEQFELMAPAGIERLLERIAQQMGGLNDKEFSAEYDRIWAICEEIRALDDETFRSKADEYVRKILGEGKLGEYAKEAAGKGRNADQLLAGLLVSPAMVRALRSRSGAE